MRPALPALAEPLMILIVACSIFELPIEEHFGARKFA
jgi:hypothetical protein